MEPELILQADILDIIFDGRNKEYGAYVLRKEYDKRMKKAMSGVIILAATMFILRATGSDHQKSSSEQFVIPDTLIIETHTNPRPVPPIGRPTQKSASIQHPTFIVTSDETSDTMTTVNDLDDDVKIGLTTQQGEVGVSDGPPPEPATGKKIPGEAVEIPLHGNEVLKRAEIMPEFPGGQAAFMRFLSKNLKVPEGGLEPGQQVKVLVRFVVGKEGELSDLQFPETTGEVFRQEVVRVMKKMPKWKPGTQNGQKVSVYFTLPIIFEGGN